MPLLKTGWPSLNVVIFSTCDAPRPGRPKTVTTPEIIDNILELILEDRRMSAKSIADKLGISLERVGSIIHEDLDMRTCPQKFPSSKILWKSSRLDFLWSRRHPPHWFSFKGPNYQRGLLLISAGAVEGHFEGKTPRGGKVTTRVLFLHDSALAHRAHATQKKLAYLGFQCLEHPPYSPDLAPSVYHFFLWTEKTIERSPFFVRRGSHCCRGDLVGRTIFRIFFQWLAKVRATG